MVQYKVLSSVLTPFQFTCSLDPSKCPHWTHYLLHPILLTNISLAINFSSFYTLKFHSRHTHCQILFFPTLEEIHATFQPLFPLAFTWPTPSPLFSLAACLRIHISLYKFIPCLNFLSCFLYWLYSSPAPYSSVSSHPILSSVFCSLTSR